MMVPTTSPARAWLSAVLTVGLAGNFGEVSRMLTSSYLAVSRYDAFGISGIYAYKALNIPQTGYAPRTENAILLPPAPTSAVSKLVLNTASVNKSRSRQPPLWHGATYDNGPRAWPKVIA